METIIFPDAVDVARTFLAAQLVATGDTDTTVGHDVTNAARRIVLELVDSQIKSLVIQTSILRVDCWVDEKLGVETAQDLGQLARGILGAMHGSKQGDVTVYAVKDAPPGLNDAPDPISGKARFSFHVAISLRGVAL